MHNWVIFFTNGLTRISIGRLFEVGCLVQTSLCLAVVRAVFVFRGLIRLKNLIVAPLLRQYR